MTSLVPKLHTLFLPLMLLSFSAVIVADDTTDFLKWKQQEKASFQAYKEARDKEFVGMLEGAWKEIRTLQGVVRDKKPKPKVIPKIKEADIPPVVEKETGKPFELPIIKHIEKIKTPVVAPLIFVLSPALKTTKSKFVFYDYSLEFTIPDSIKPSLAMPLSQKSIAESWKRLSQADYEPLIKQLQHYQTQLGLGDWGKVQLTWRMATTLTGFSSNEQRLLTWFLLAKQGFDARTAYGANHLFLLLPSHHELYETEFFTLNKQHYYWINLSKKLTVIPAKVHTYKGLYPDANQKLNMQFVQTINPSKTKQTRALVFNYAGEKHRVNIEYAPNRIAFLKTYPQIDIALYFNSSLAPRTKKSLLTQLRPLVKGKTEQEAVNLLLRFVQTSFTYATDAKQFGEENYLTVEETLFYPFSDCEDRSILFAWLVKNVLNLKVIGVTFPGHVATAVALNTVIDKNNLSYQHIKFTLADPTYVNANIGMKMPIYKAVKPKVIPAL